MFLYFRGNLLENTETDLRKIKIGSPASPSHLPAFSKLLPVKGVAIPGQGCHPPVLDSLVYLGKENMNSQNNGLNLSKWTHLVKIQ